VRASKKLCKFFLAELDKILQF